MQPAGRRGGVDRDERTVVGALDPLGVDRHAGRGLVVGEGVQVDAVRRPTAVGAVPGSLFGIDGSSRNGARAAAAANFDENSPNTRCWLRCSIRPKTAASQKTVVPPLPSSTS